MARKKNMQEKMEKEMEKEMENTAPKETDKEEVVQEEGEQEGESTSEETINSDSKEETPELTEEESHDEVAELKEKYLRIYSEFENFRRRTAKERLELISTASEGIISALLPVIDDFERAAKSTTEDARIEDLKEGYKLIHQKMVKTLEDKGMKKMEIEAGDDFDPDFHEAVTQIPAPEDEMKGKIVDVIENGYQLGEKVIRYAKVVTGA